MDTIDPVTMIYQQDTAILRQLRDVLFIEENISDKTKFLAVTLGQIAAAEGVHEAKRGEQS